MIDTFQREKQENTGLPFGISPRDWDKMVNAYRRIEIELQRKNFAQDKSPGANQP